MLARLHVDEVDDDQATEVTQAKLARHFISGFKVGVERGRLDVAAFSGARRVHVDRNQRFGVVDYDRAARRQVDRTAKRAFDLMLDLEAREERHVVLVKLHTADRVWHHMTHEAFGLLVHVFRVDQDFANVGRVVVADRANHEA